MRFYKKIITPALLPTVFALAGPTMLEQLMQTAVQYIDTAMVGSLGTHATAAVGATTTVNWLIGSTVSAVAVAFLSFVAQARGAGQPELGRRAAAQAVLAVLALGALFTVLPLSLSPLVPRWMQVDEAVQGTATVYFFIIYTPMLARVASIIFGTLLRAVGDTKTPMKVGIAVNLINVVLNFFLIYETRTVAAFGTEFTLLGAGMGVIGAGIATAISYFIGGAVTTVAFLLHREITPRGESLRPDKTVLYPCLKIAAPNALQRFGTSLGYVIFAALVNSLGEVATAAHTIANTVESAFYIPGYGMQSATATLSGNAYGANDARRLRELTRTIITVEALMMVISGGLLYAFAPGMMSLFSSDPEVIELGARVLRMVALSEPFYGISIVIEGSLQGMGKTTMPFVANITGMWLIRIVGTFLCIRFLSGGLISAWACMILHNLSLFFMFVGYYLFGKWAPKSDKIELNVN